MTGPGRLLGAVLLLALAVAATALAEDKRNLPFTKQAVFSYFRQLDEAKQALPDNLKPEEFRTRQCQLYAEVLKKSGYDFETTVQNAVQFADRGNRKMDDPRFLFLAAVFQTHPDVFVKLKLLSQATRDAVVSLLSP